MRGDTCSVPASPSDGDTCSVPVSPSKAVRVVLQEASSLGLEVDIANGPGWPISVPQIKDADDPAALYELTYGTLTLHGATSCSNKETGLLALPERRVKHDEGTPRLVGVCAYRLVGPKLLDETSYVDLMSHVHGDGVRWQPPEDGCNWVVFCFWGQPACH